MSQRPKHFVSPHCTISLTPAGPAQITFGGQSFKVCPFALISMAQAFSAAADMLERQAAEARMQLDIEDQRTLH
ncbi:MAG: hypothetical protein ACE366_16040 [Bradymonadia bacterium]